MVFQLVHLGRFSRDQHGEGDHDFDYNALVKQQVVVQRFVGEDQIESIPYQRMLQNLDLGYHWEAFREGKNHATVVLDEVRAQDLEVATGWKVGPALVHYANWEAALLVRQKGLEVFAGEWDHTVLLVADASPHPSLVLNEEGA